MYTPLKERVRQMDFSSIEASRKEVLAPMIDYLRLCIDSERPIRLNFICTHNSRRSQFAELWAQVAADYFGINASSYSGGVEVTAFNERAVASLQRFGFKVEVEGEGNPRYLVSWRENMTPHVQFSKLYDDVVNPASDFAAIMTCSHADEHCPYIPNCTLRIAVRYEDPKAFDDTPLEAQMYDTRSMEIATELFYVFSQLTSNE